MINSSVRILNNKQRIAKLSIQYNKNIYEKESIYPSSSIQPEFYDFKNGLVQSKLYNRKKLIFNILNALIVINIVLLFVYYEYDYEHVEKSLLYCDLSFGTNALMSILVVFIVKQQYNHLSQRKSRHNSYFQAAFKIISILFFHPFSKINTLTTSISYRNEADNTSQCQLKLNYLLVFIALLRNIFLLLSGLMINSDYFQPRANRICQIYIGNINQYLFAIRCLFKDTPLKLIIIIQSITIIFFSFGIWMFQRNLPVSPNLFEYYQNSIWFIFITVTTVGYGDIVARANLSYLLLFFCIIIGSLNISAVIYYFVKTLGQLNTNELQALQQLKRINYKSVKKNTSKQYIRQALWRLWKNYKLKQNMKESSYERSMRINLRRYKKITIPGDPTCNFVQQIQQNFSKNVAYVDLLLQNNRNLMNFISQNMFLQSKTSISTNISTGNTQSDSNQQYTQKSFKCSVNILEGINEYPQQINITKGNLQITSINSDISQN